jgi:hypothetical protein
LYVRDRGLPDVLVMPPGSIALELLLDAFLVASPLHRSLGCLPSHARVVLLVENASLLGLSMHGQGLLLQVLDETLQVVILDRLEAKRRGGWQG